MAVHGDAQSGAHSHAAEADLAPATGAVASSSGNGGRSNTASSSVSGGDADNSTAGGGGGGEAQPMPSGPAAAATQPCGPAGAATQPGTSAMQATLTSQPRFVRELIAGGVAGGLAKTSIAPLERTKILLQTGQTESMGIAGTLAFLFKTEGLAGMFRGNGASVLRIVPYAAIHFSAYEWYRRLIVDRWAPERDDANVRTIASGGGGEGGRGGGGGGASDPTAAAVPPSSSSGAHQRMHGGMQSPLTSPVTPSLLSSPPLPTVSSSHRSPPPLSLSPSSSFSPSSSLSFSPSSPSSSSSPSLLPSSHNDPRIDLLAGAASGASAVLLTYPLDLMRAQLAWSAALSMPQAGGQQGAAAGSSSGGGGGGGSGGAVQCEQRAGFRQLLRNTLAEQGVIGLYRGVGPTLLGILPYAGLKFYSYQSMKIAFQERQAAAAAAAGAPNGAQPAKLPVPIMLLFGGVSGLIAQTITYPLDLIRRRQQVDSMLRARGTGDGHPRTSLAVLRSIIAEHGMKGLFRGVSINYIKAVPSTAIGFTVYDQLKSYLGLQNHLT